MLTTLGVRFRDAAGNELPLGGAALARLATIDLTVLDLRLREVALEVAADVDNPLCGSSGAALTFGPQKGTSPAEALALDVALAHYADVAAATLCRDLLDAPGAGAAGGLGFRCAAFLGARLRPGVEIVADFTRRESARRELCDRKHRSSKRVRYENRSREGTCTPPAQSDPSLVFKISDIETIHGAAGARLNDRRGATECRRAAPRRAAAALGDTVAASAASGSNAEDQHTRCDASTTTSQARRAEPVAARDRAMSRTTVESDQARPRLARPAHRPLTEIPLAVCG